MTAYVTKRLAVDAVQWTGANLAEIRDFAGPDFLEAGTAGRAWVRNAEGPYELRPGYWLSREPGHPLIIVAPHAWQRLYEPAGGTT